MSLRVLTVSSSPERARALRASLEAPELTLLPAVSFTELPGELSLGGVDVVLVDLECLGPDPAAEVRRLRTLARVPPRVVVLAGSSSEGAFRLGEAGALATLGADPASGALRALLRGLADRDAAPRVRATPSARRLSFGDAAESPAMKRFLATVRRVIESESTMLLLGETGVGKDLLAHELHERGPRAAGPFVAVNCPALPEALFESELFGHAAGAFTGATKPRRGEFERAHGGTLFLDEIAELPPHVQVKLLRVLEERRVRPVGADRSIAVDVRVLAATNRDLVAEMAAGRFRADLYYRLAGITLEIPALRDRREDIPVLARGHFERLRLKMRRPVRGLLPETLQVLSRHAWPGNVRELVNVLERAVLLAEGEWVTPEDLPLELRRPAELSAPTVWSELPFRDARRRALEQFERSYLVELLERSGGRVGEAAEVAGLDPRSLYEKMRQLGLRKEDFRPRRLQPRTAKAPDRVGERSPGADNDVPERP